MNVSMIALLGGEIIKAYFFIEQYILFCEYFPKWEHDFFKSLLMFQILLNSKIQVFNQVALSVVVR